MRVAILGYGEQGRAAYEYWLKPGLASSGSLVGGSGIDSSVSDRQSESNEITICDQNQQVELPANVGKKQGADYLAGLDEFDLIVRSPSVHPADIAAANTPEILDKVTTVTDEFFKVCPSKNIIGVTGTKGKGTTSTLIFKMLEAAGHKVHLGGNIGTPPLDMLKAGIQPDDWVVLELANFQLIDIKHSPHIAVVLMVIEEHLNWHKDMNEYVTSKQQMFRWQQSDDVAVYYGLSSYSQHIASVSPGQKIPYMKNPGADVIEGIIAIDGQQICHVNEIKLLGKHNWQNICAAVTAIWQVTKDVDKIKSVLTSFAGLEHRLELVREFNGVKYYDDSFGTTPETAIVAIEAFEQPKVIILGGSDKGANYEELARTVKNSEVRSAVLIGKMGPKIKEALDKVAFTNTVEGGTTMEQIVKTAQSQAQSGDIVLLSTACASYDMFKNYKDRGEQFKQVVQAFA